MKRNILFGAVLFCTTSLIAADTASDIKAAAKKLADKGSYSWKTTSESATGNRGRFGPTEGKTDKDGFIQLSMTRGDNTTEAVLKSGKGAVKTEDGWKSLSEAAESGGDGGGFNPRQFVARMLQNYKAPAAEAEELSGKTKDLKKDGDAYAGDLTAEGVKSLLGRFRRPGGDAPEVENPKGTIKFWLKDGVLSKYEYNVQGRMSFNNNDVDINRTTTVEIKDIGTTKVDVPEEAKKKIG
jgi:hypothetical protein